MTNSIYYFAEADASPAKADGHYLRLGEYDATEEAAIATDTDEGILIHTSGRWTLKVTGATHEEVNGKIDRTIATGDYTYDNTSGSLRVEAQDGGIKIKAKNNINFTTTKDPSDVNVTVVTVEAKDSHDIYFDRHNFESRNTVYQERMTEGFRHKTNLGWINKATGGMSISTYLSFGISYKSFTIAAKGFSVNMMAPAVFALGSISKKVVVFFTVSFQYIYYKKALLDEEFCVVKNEQRNCRFSGTLAEARDKIALIKALGIEKEEKVIGAHFDRLHLTL